VLVPAGGGILMGISIGEQVIQSGGDLVQMVVKETRVTI
jgi:hypothetical protein